MQFDCQQCGACCSPLDYAVDWVTVTQADVARLLPAERLHVLPRPRGEYVGDLLTVTGRPDNLCACCFLAGRIGENVSCMIYERRPQGCRDFENGSQACLDARAKAGVK